MYNNINRYENSYKSKINLITFNPINTTMVSLHKQWLMRVPDCDCNKTDCENTTLLNSCNQVHTFTNISDTKYATLTINAKRNLSAINLEMIS